MTRTRYLRKAPRYKNPPVFQCTQCGCLDDARRSTTTRWSAGLDKAKCTFCHTGRWHHVFDRKTPEEWGYEPDGKGHFVPKDGTTARVS